MTDKPTTLQQLMDDDQPPKSPAALDQAILAHARARAKPADKPRWSDRLTASWMPVLAAASVASIAVMIVWQQPPSTALHEAKDYPQIQKRELSTNQLATNPAQQKKAAPASASLQQATALEESVAAEQREAKDSAANVARLFSAPQAPTVLSDNFLASAKSQQPPMAAADPEPESSTRFRSSQAFVAEPDVSMAEKASKPLALRKQLPAAGRAAAASEVTTFEAWGLQQTWQLQISESAVQFIEADGTRHAFTGQLPVTEALGSGDQEQVFQLSNQQHRIGITLHTERCEGERQVDAQQVTVVFDDLALKGCGKSLP